MNPCAHGRVSSSYSTSGTRRVNLVTNPVISHERGKDREVFETNRTYPSSFVSQIVHNDQPSHVKCHTGINLSTNPFITELIMNIFEKLAFLIWQCWLRSWVLVIYIWYSNWHRLNTTEVSVIKKYKLGAVDYYYHLINFALWSLQNIAINIIEGGMYRCCLYY